MLLPFIGWRWLLWGGVCGLSGLVGTCAGSSLASIANSLVSIHRSHCQQSSRLYYNLLWLYLPDALGRSGDVWGLSFVSPLLALTICRGGGRDRDSMAHYLIVCLVLFSVRLSHP